MEARRWGRTIALALIACGGERAAPPAPAVADPPAFPTPRSDNLPYACSITDVFKSLQPGRHVEICGLLPRDVSPAEIEATTKCIRAAESRRQPYLVARKWDSDIALGHMVTFDAGARLDYEAHYDSDPWCGGECPQVGGTIVRRCQHTGSLNLLDPRWYAGECEGSEVIESCTAGAPGILPLTYAALLRDELVARSPAQLSATVGPLQLGAPKADLEPGSPVWAVVSMIEATGLVHLYFEPHESSAVNEVLILGFRGPCSAIRTMLESRWGASKAGTWDNKSVRQRARLDLAKCHLRVERYTEQQSASRG